MLACFAFFGEADLPKIPGNKPGITPEAAIPPAAGKPLGKTKPPPVIPLIFPAPIGEAIPPIAPGKAPAATPPPNIGCVISGRLAANWPPSGTFMKICGAGVVVVVVVAAVVVVTGTIIAGRRKP